MTTIREISIEVGSHMPEGAVRPVKKFQPNMLFMLDNAEYANNCFLNVVIQNIWHLSGFHRILKDVILEAKRLEDTNEECDKVFY